MWHTPTVEKGSSVTRLYSTFNVKITWYEIGPIKDMSERPFAGASQNVAPRSTSYLAYPTTHASHITTLPGPHQPYLGADPLQGRRPPASQAWAERCWGLPEAAGSPDCSRGSSLGGTRAAPSPAPSQALGRGGRGVMGMQDVWGYGRDKINVIGGQVSRHRRSYLVGHSEHLLLISRNPCQSDWCLLVLKLLAVAAVVAFAVWAALVSLVPTSLRWVKAVPNVAIKQSKSQMRW